MLTISKTTVQLLEDDNLQTVTPGPSVTSSPTAGDVTDDWLGRLWVSTAHDAAVRAPTAAPLLGKAIPRVSTIASARTCSGTGVRLRFSTT